MKNKKWNIFLFISFTLFFVLLLTNEFSKYINDLDELWNYNFSNCIAQGLVPYKDLNMITTPFLHILVGIVLKFTFNNLMVYRVICAVVSTGVLFLVYLIIKKIIENRYISLILTCIFCCIYYNFFRLDYNFFSLLLFLIIEYIELLKIDKERIFKHNLIIGVLIGLIICTKQTIGIFVLLAIIISELILYRKIENKKLIKQILLILAGCIIPIIVLVVYLLINGAFYDFIDYTILGISTFKNSVSYIELLHNYYFIIRLFAILLPVFAVISIIVNTLYRKTEKKETVALLASIPMLIVIYPIANVDHFLVGIAPLFIYFLVTIYNLLKFICNKFNNKFIKYIKIAIKIFLALFIVYNVTVLIYNNISKYINHAEDYSKIKHFENILNFKCVEERIKSFNEFKKDKNNIIIADSEACIYFIPQDKYNKDFDTFNIGNFGQKSEEGIIEHIKESKDMYYLVKNNDDYLNWQAPKNVIYYIRNNLEHKETVQFYDIVYDVYYKN